MLHLSLALPSGYARYSQEPIKFAVETRKFPAIMKPVRQRLSEGSNQFQPYQSARLTFRFPKRLVLIGFQTI
jgi:hypothetical protein